MAQEKLFAQILSEVAEICAKARKAGWSDKVTLTVVKMWLSRYWVT